MRCQHLTVDVLARARWRVEVACRSPSVTIRGFRVCGCCVWKAVMLQPYFSHPRPRSRSRDPSHDLTREEIEHGGILDVGTRVLGGMHVPELAARMSASEMQSVLESASVIACAAMSVAPGTFEHGTLPVCQLGRAFPPPAVLPRCSACTLTPGRGSGGVCAFLHTAKCPPPSRDPVCAAVLVLDTMASRVLGSTRADAGSEWMGCIRISRSIDGSVWYALRPVCFRPRRCNRRGGSRWLDRCRRAKWGFQSPPSAAGGVVVRVRQSAARGAWASADEMAGSDPDLAAYL